jgi:anti-sigma regulatory factor (Ser/Thr protein kinase)
MVTVNQDDIKILSDRPHWISLQIRCKLTTVDRLTQFVRELPSDLDPDERERIATAFRELLLNAIEHGGHLDPEKTVDLSNTPEQPFRHVELRQQMGIRPGGFGLLMTKSFADELIYSAKGNEVILIKYL